MDAQLTSITGVERRRFGEMERLLHALHNWGGLIATQVLHIRGDLDPALVRQALDYMQASHPLLRAHIEVTGIGLRKTLPPMTLERDFVLKGTTEIPLTVVTGDWQEVLRKELRTPIPYGRNPRARSVLVRAGADGIHRIVTTMDHSVGDAQAGGMASRSLMAFLGDPTLRRPAALGLPPSLEEVFPKKSDSGRPAEHVIRLPLKPKRGQPHDTFMETRELSADDTAAVHAAARSHRTTTHGAIAASILSAVRERYGVDRMAVDSTFDMRRLCKPPLPDDTFGCYIDALRTTHTLGQEFWTTAREVAFKVIAAMAKDQESASIVKWPGVRFMAREAMPLITSGFRLDGIGVTTSGDFDLKRTYGDFVLEDITVAISMHWAGPGFFALTMEREGRMRLTLCYTPYVVPPADAAALADHAITLLRNLPA